MMPTTDRFSPAKQVAPADDRLIGVEPALPQPVADDDYAAVVGLSVGTRPYRGCAPSVVKNDGVAWVTKSWSTRPSTRVVDEPVP